MSAARWSHLAVSVDELPAARGFYEALGFTAGEVYHSAGRRVAALMESESSRFDGLFLRLGDVRIELLAYDPPRLPARSTRAADEVGYAHISLMVEDLDALLAELRRHGGTVRTTLEHTFAEGLTTVVFVTDPSGNRVELIEHSDVAEREAHGAFLGIGDLGWPD